MAIKNGQMKAYYGVIDTKPHPKYCLALFCWLIASRLFVNNHDEADDKAIETINMSEQESVQLT